MSKINLSANRIIGSTTKQNETIASVIAKQATQDVPGKTPVTILQEILIKIGQTPQYEFYTNDTNPVTFTCTVICVNKQATGTGKSKKDAKHEAARSMIEQLYEETSKETTSKDFYKNDDKDNNGISKLKLICKKYNLDKPKYIEGKKIPSPHGKTYYYHCIVGNFDTEGTGPTSNLAMQDSAEKMIEKLNTIYFKNKNEEQDNESCDRYDFPKNLSNKSSGKIVETLISKEILVESTKNLDCYQLGILNYLFNLASNCSKNLNSKEINIPKTELVILRNELEKFLELKNIDFYHMVIQNSEHVAPDRWLFAFQLNSEFNMCAISLGKTQEEAELRAMNKIIAALKKKFID